MNKTISFSNYFTNLVVIFIEHHIIKSQENTMSLMSVNEVADFLGVQESRVMRLEREHLLIAKEKSADDQPMFDKGDVAKYKELAERLGGI
jgi:hypothetical protein